MMSVVVGAVPSRRPMSRICWYFMSSSRLRTCSTLSADITSPVFSFPPVYSSSDSNSSG